MRVPRFWSEHRVHLREPELRATVQRFGWSDDSQHAADEHAKERAEEAARELRAGEKVVRREVKVPYNGADGLPIREEVISTHLDGTAVVTRNSYGARCLNVEDVLFADIDDPPPPDFGVFGCAIIVAVAYTAFRIVSEADGGVAAAWALSVAASLVAIRLLAWLQGVLERRRNARGGAKAVARKYVESFVEAHPEWHVRLYETPGGLRALAMHRTFDPVDDWKLISRFFRHVGGDPVYERMCRLQRCFRARLSPKPWRIGIEDHLKPRPGVWPVDPARMPDRERWVARYEEAVEGVASCRLVGVIGADTVDRRCEAVRDLHDRLSRALDEGAEIA